MFKRILVPLDGSARAERAAFVAARCARRVGSALVLLRVVHAPARLGLTGEPPILAMAAAEGDVMQVSSYLEQFARREEFRDIDVETEALEGHVASTILEVAAEDRIDALMLCSHGRSGFTRWALGSIAHTLARYSPVPVFVLRAKDDTFPTDEARGLRALVALDGSGRAERAILPAADLIESLSEGKQATIRLVRVVAGADAIESGAHHTGAGDVVDRQHQLHAHMMEEANSYLREVSERLLKGELAGRMIAVEYDVIAHPDVGGALIDAATGAMSPGACDVIAIATHGRTGVQGLMVGSIAERVLDAAPIPMLVVSTREQRAQETVAFASREMDATVPPREVDTSGSVGV